MLTIEQMNQFGANTAEGVARCAGMEAIYLKLVKMVPSEANFDKLKTALDAGDLDGAFAAAHALKGVLGNLSLTPMYKIIDEMTELLRSGTDTDYSGMMNELMDLKARLTEMCAD